MNIKDATSRAKFESYIDPNLIICLGYVDILNGQDLRVLKRDFLNLISALSYRGVEPVVCTLPPLLQKTENLEVQKKIQEFNGFLLKQKHWNVIDLNRQFVRAGNIVESFYQPWVMTCITVKMETVIRNFLRFFQEWAESFWHESLNDFVEQAWPSSGAQRTEKLCCQGVLIEFEFWNILTAEIQMSSSQFLKLNFKI